MPSLKNLLKKSLPFLLAGLLLISPPSIMAADDAGAGGGGGGGGSSTQNAPRLDILNEGASELPQIVSVDEDDPGSEFGSLISRILQIILAIAAFLVLLNLVLGALGWITAGGDSGKLEKARTRMLNAVIGIIVLAAVLAILQLLFNFLNLEGITISD